MDVGRAFSYPFRDSRWVGKLLIGTVMLLIPIFGWFSLGGYGMRIMRSVVAGRDTPLPEWESFGELFIDGLKWFVVAIFWGIPGILISIINAGVDSLTLSCLGTIVGWIASVLTAIAVVAVATTGDFNAGFRVGEVIERLTRNAGDYAIVFLMQFVVAVVILLGLIAFCVGVLATAAYGALITAHLWAQAYRRSEGLGDLPPVPRF